MIKIGILTFHRSINNGAVVQCYALSRRIQQDFPDAVVEVIDYHMPKAEKMYDTSFRGYMKGSNFRAICRKLLNCIEDPYRFRRLKERKQAFQDVLHVLPLSEKSIYSDGTEELFNYIDRNYDIVIAGSDAIWNYKVRGFPNPYFLSGDTEVKLFSYAASCFGMDYCGISQEKKDAICKILNRYTLLGTRDAEAENFLADIGCMAPMAHTCDPTVLLDVQALPVDVTALEEKLRSRHYDFSKATIAVMGTEAMCKMVRKMYGSSCQIVALYNYCKSADVNLYDLNPYEWAYVFRYFQVVVTTYFHGTLVSLRNGTPVVCIALQTAYTQKYVPKALDFLGRVHMQDCYFETDYQSRNLSKIKAKIDYYITHDCRQTITDFMNQEAQTYLVFHDALKNTIQKLKETKND